VSRNDVSSCKLESKSIAQFVLLTPTVGAYATRRANTRGARGPPPHSLVIAILLSHRDKYSAHR
jgi:hypothetical protein